MDLFNLVASLQLDSSNYQKGIAEAKAGGQGLANSLEKTFAKIKTAFAAVVSVAVVKKVTDAAMGLANQTASVADRIDKQSQALGISRKAFQQWDYILAQSGASIDSLGVSMKTLNSAILGGDKSAVEAFKQLGLKLTDLQGLSQEDAFNKVIDAFQRMPQDARKSALAVQLLGRQGQTLMPLLNTTADGMAELRRNTERLGFVMSDSMIDAGVRFGDKLDDLKRTAGGLKNTLGYALLEPLTGIFEAITNFMSQENVQMAFKRFAVDLNNMGNIVLTGVQTFFNWINENGETIGGYLSNVGSFLHDIWEVVSGFAVELVTELTSAFQDFLANASPEQLAALGALAIAIGLLASPVMTLGGLVVLLAMNWDTFKEKASSAIKTANDFFTQELPTTIHDKLQGLSDKLAPLETKFDEVRPKIKAFFEEKAPDTLKNAIDAVSTAFSSVVRWVRQTKKRIGTWLENSDNPAIQTFASVVNTVADAFSSVANWIRRARSRLTAWLRSLDNPAAQAFADIIDKVATAFGNVTTKIREAIKALKDWKEEQANKRKEQIDNLDREGLTSNDTTRAVNAWNNYEALWNEANGFAAGINYVPSNGMPAILHEGEAVLNKRDATTWRGGSNQPQISAAALASAMTSALEGMAVVMDKEQVGRLTAQTVSRELARKARAGRFAFA